MIPQANVVGDAVSLVMFNVVAGKSRKSEHPDSMSKSDRQFEFLSNWHGTHSVFEQWNSATFLAYSKFTLTTYLRFAKVRFLNSGVNPTGQWEGPGLVFLEPKRFAAPLLSHLSNSPFPFLPPEAKGAYG